MPLNKLFNSYLTQKKTTAARFVAELLGKFQGMGQVTSRGSGQINQGDPNRPARDWGSLDETDHDPVKNRGNYDGQRYR